MKRFLIILLLLVCCGCRMMRHEAERSIKKDAKEFLDDNFDSYANSWYSRKCQLYKERFGWTLGTSSGVVALVGGITGLLVYKKKKNANV